MIFCCGNGPLASICISFDDDRLAYDFCRVYPFRIIDSPNEVSMVVNRASGNTNIYAVYAPKYNIDAKGTKQEVIGYIDWLVDDTLRLKTSSEIVSIHGSSSIVQGKTMTCIGVSNSGKTSLSLSIAKMKGGYIGDEYASINLTSGHISHEDYPIQIKQASDRLFEDPVNPPLPVMSRTGVLSKASLPEDYGIATFKGDYPIGMLLFPSYNPFSKKSNICKINIRSLHKVLMPSVVGLGSRSAIFTSLLRIIISNRIPCYSVEYSDCAAASAAIILMVVQQENWSDDELV